MKTISELTIVDFEECIDSLSMVIPLPINTLIEKVDELAKIHYNGELVSNNFIQELSAFIGTDNLELATAILNNINGKLYE